MANQKASGCPIFPLVSSCRSHEIPWIPHFPIRYHKSWVWSTKFSSDALDSLGRKVYRGKRLRLGVPWSELRWRTCQAWMAWSLGEWDALWLLHIAKIGPLMDDRMMSPLTSCTSADIHIGTLGAGVFDPNSSDLCPSTESVQSACSYHVIYTYIYIYIHNIHIYNINI